MLTDRLRLILRLNATTSALGGAIAAIAAGWVSETLGIDHVLLTRLVGIGLILFAADVAYVSTRDEKRMLAETRLISAGDGLWVLATIAVLAAQILTTTGVVVAILVGLGVADFGIAQLWLRSKILGQGDAEAETGLTAAGA